jgi:hypothetical protein
MFSLSPTGKEHPFKNIKEVYRVHLIFIVKFTELCCSLFQHIIDTNCMTEHNCYFTDGSIKTNIN